ncbi:MAG: hypothetical protein ACLUHK_04010 [Eubacteriales bacterium]
MLKKSLSLLLCLLFAFTFALFGCAEKGGEQGGPAGGGEEEGELPEEDLGVNVIADGTFKDGFNLLGTNSATDGTTVFKKIKYGSSLGSPKWKLCQWGTKYNLKDGDEKTLADRYTLSDRSKTLSVDMETFGVTLAVNAAEEYDSFNTSAPSVWPHFLVEQNFSQPVSVADAKSLTAKLDFKVDKSEDKRGGEGLHAQFAWFIYIVDQNPESEGYGNFLWFGLNIFAPPNEVAGGYSSQDTAGGLGNYIYSLSADTFMEEMPAAGKETHVSFDFLPYIESGLAAAKEKGFMPGTDLEDCYITGTNIGWEVFDRWDVSITIEEIGIYKK